MFNLGIIEAEPLSYEKGSTYKDKVCLLEITLYIGLFFI